jgi:hypothetical protein
MTVTERTTATIQATVPPTKAMPPS